jgi:16S rRNA (uracil1498-N3)-methyltransferase
MDCAFVGARLMARFFVDTIEGDSNVLFVEDAKHMARILRLRQGDVITALDGMGKQAQAEILFVSEREVRAQAADWEPVGTEPRIRVTVYQGLCRGERFETVVQKCTELGAAMIVPLCLARCDVKPQEVHKRLPRYAKIAREAAKQSGRGLVPQIADPISLDGVPINAHDLIIAPYELEKANGLRAVLAGNEAARDIGIVIGPEGGLEASEAASLRGIGAHLVTLGPRILRTETAAPAVLAVLMAQLGEWDGESD